MTQIDKISFENGVWRGLVTLAPGTAKDATVQVQYRGEPLGDVQIANGPSALEKVIDIPIPSRAIGDGVHTFVISIAGQAEPIGTFSIASGHALDHDLLTELSLLREELELVKRTLRHRFSDS